MCVCWVGQVGVEGGVGVFITGLSVSIYKYVTHCRSVIFSDS